MSEETDLREVQLRDELRRLEAMDLNEEAASTFTGQLVQAQTDRRLSDIRQELNALRDRHLEVRLVDPRDGHAVDTGLLGQILRRFQSSLDYIGWALRAGPGIEGDPPTFITRRTSTEVLALPTGSFKIVLRGTTLELDYMSDETRDELSSLLEESLGRILALARAGEMDEFPDSLEELTHELGAQPTRRLSLWFKKLADNSLTTSLTPAADPRQTVTVTPPQARAISEWLAHVQDTVENITVRGVLRIADEVRGRFGIEDAAERLYEGKAAPELVQHKQIGAEYVASVQVTVRYSDHTGARRETYTLLSLTTA